MSPRFEQTVEEEKTEWIVTYGDMVTLLLCFFVAMASMANYDTERFKKTMEAIQGHMSSPNRPSGESEKRQSMELVIGQREQSMISQINSAMAGLPTNLQNVVSAQFDRKKLIITVLDMGLFAPGRVELLPGAATILEPVSKVLLTFPEFTVDIKGHTDAPLPPGSPYPSNWELTALRATAVLRFMIDRGMLPRRMTATGLADVDPLAPRDASEEDKKHNRRVEFVLEKEK